MLNSMCLHVKEVIDGLAIPDQAKPLAAFIQPPPLQVPSGPMAYIWSSTGSWKRQSMPRGPGFQEFEWPMDIWCTLLTSTQVPVLDQVMNSFVDAVLISLLTTEMPIFVTDPANQRQSQLLMIAESGKIQNPPGRLTDDMRMLQYSSGISVTVKEAIQI